MHRRASCGTRGAWLPGLCLTVVLTGGGCLTNPYTGRSQLLMMPASKDMQLGVQAYHQVLTDPQIKQSTDPRETVPVKRVVARVIEAAKQSKYADMAQQFAWEVTVIKDDKTVNAFALPGGKIAVYTGNLPGSEDGSWPGGRDGARGGACARASWRRAHEPKDGGQCREHSRGDGLGRQRRHASPVANRHGRSRSRHPSGRLAPLQPHP